jgi:hypothetical protein
MILHRFPILHIHWTPHKSKKCQQLHWLDGVEYSWRNEDQWRLGLLIREDGIKLNNFINSDSPIQSFSKSLASRTWTECTGDPNYRYARDTSWIIHNNGFMTRFWTFLLFVRFPKSRLHYPKIRLVASQKVLGWLYPLHSPPRSPRFSPFDFSRSHARYDSDFFRTPAHSSQNMLSWSYTLCCFHLVNKELRGRRYVAV